MTGRVVAEMVGYGRFHGAGIAAAGCGASLAGLLWHEDAADGGSIAIVDREHAMDYDSLRARASAIAHALADAGVRPGDRVAVLLERGPDAAAALFGVYAAGGVAVLVNERYRSRQIEHILDHATVRMLLTEETLLARQPRPLETDARILYLPGIPARGSFAPVSRNAGDVAQIIFTSGSSGLPKGVAFTHGNLWAGIRAVVGYLGLQASDRIMSLLPFTSVYGLNQLLCAIAPGARLIVELSPVPHQIVASIRAHEATVAAGVPPLWLQLLTVPGFRSEPVASLRQLQNAGGHLPVEAVRKLREAQPQARLFLQYGMTETFRSTYLPPDEVDRHPDSMGRAVPGTEIFVVREDGSECAVGEVGELVHRGPTVAAGYWNDPERTAATFRANPLRPSGAPDAERVVFSGDMVRRDEEGRLYFVSRRDRMIKTLGYRVGPDEIVDVLYASGQITEALIATEPDAQRGEKIIAFVVLAPGGSRDRLELFCRTELPRYMHPGRIEVRDVIPRMPSGKYDVAAAKGSAAT